MTESHDKTIQRHRRLLDSALGESLLNLLNDPDVIEIMLNPDGSLWSEKLGQGKTRHQDHLSPLQVANVIKIFANQHQQVVTADHPELACELPEFSARLQAWLPPVASSPTFTIRKLAAKIFTLENYVTEKRLQKDTAEFLRQAVLQRKNILVAGGTGSGKTTFANALLHELMDTKERVIVLEDLPELQISAADHVALRTTENKAMRDLVKGALRMRPDRIIIGEVRDGGAVLEMLKAWNTGHPGGICTVHANSVDGSLLRLHDLLLEVVAQIPPHLITSAIDIIVFMARNQEGQPYVAEVKELLEGKNM